MDMVAILGHLCRRPMLFSENLKSGQDLLATMQGMGTGAARIKQEIRVNTFLAFVGSQFAEGDGKPWFIVLSHLYSHFSLKKACETTLELIDGWKRAVEPESALPLHDKGDNYATAQNVYPFFVNVLRDPQSFLPEVSEFRTLLMFLHGFEIGSYPPHGSSTWGGDLNKFVNRHFQKSLGIRSEGILLSELATCSFDEACAAYADLVCSWLETQK